MTQPIENRTLIIFPGAGSPSNPLYLNVYNLVEHGAIKYGYKYVDLSVRWEGQVGLEISASLNFRSSLETATKRMREYEDAGIPYDILGRSYGTYVAMKSAESLRPKLLSRLILWGIPPFWRMWQIYVRDFESTYEIAKTKGVSIGRDLFASLEPIEPLICGTTYHVIVASGTADIYSTPDDIASFRALTGNDKIVFRKPVERALHEVTDENSASLVDEYFRALFQ